MSEWIGELAAVRQLPRLAVRAPRLLAQRRGHGEPVMVLPGRGVGDASTAPLRAYLVALGYRCRGWGLGVDDGDMDRLVPGVSAALLAMVGDDGRPVALVGQSLGGYVAREVARDHPELVSQVITIGTPIFGARSSRSLRRPVTAIASRADRIVSWSRAFDRSPEATNVEVASTHMGMGIDPDVWRVVANTLRSSDG